MGEGKIEFEVQPALQRLGLARPGEQPRFERLTGGVSSDIWRVDLARGPVCVKRALAKLRVEQDWFAPVERNAYEAAWMRRAAAVVPEAVPALLGPGRRGGRPGHGLSRSGAPPPLEGRAARRPRRSGRSPRAVGERLVRIHAATARRSGGRGASSPTDRIFHDIRLEPYLLATAGRHPDRAAALAGAGRRPPRATRRALVHGDVSPKNILIGPSGPVFLDAECAWYGDPAFDLAFCLNHLLLKCLWTPRAAPGFLDCFDALAESYLAGVGLGAARRRSRRARRALLPGLLLARVDGKSPVEYLTRGADKDRVRRVARALLAAPARRLARCARPGRGSSGR